ncbi:ABC transporter transmembrane region [Ancylostoma duodenale]|uniref:ABC transporter transmembrane region n=1 Tax=Ancylostoma duodenale TaxID=51022 RepID=A0A0C2DQ90_9BILA|nr:ABC transporter transmembrane region [Ancylostoma duodenale]
MKSIPYVCGSSIIMTFRLTTAAYRSYASIFWPRRFTVMVSAFNDFDQCKDGWPIQPSCSRLIGFGIYTALAVLNLIVACMPRVDGLAHPETFQYSLIYISTLLKFLQGNGAMGGFLNTLRSYLWIPIQQYTTRELEVELFAHLHSLSLRWHLSRKTGLVLRVMDRGTSSVNSILNYILFNIVPTITDIIIAVVFFFSTFNFYFGGIVCDNLRNGMAHEIPPRHEREENASSAIATDSLLNYETVKYYGNEMYEVDRFRHAIECFQLAEWRSNASLALLNFLQNGLIGLGMTAGSVLVAYLITVDKQLTVGDYVLFTTYILQLYAPLNFFGTVYRTIQKSFIDMENMFDLMNEEVDVRDSPNAVEYHPTEGKISVNNLVFAYNENRIVLNGISFEVGSGQSVALVGPSGSGKSTLIRLLFRLFECPEGSVSYDGMDVRHLKLRSLRKQIGIVPQDTVLFNDTIKPAASTYLSRTTGIGVQKSIKINKLEQ